MHWNSIILLILLISEIEVDSTRAIDAVVKSDKHRLALIEKEAQLTKKLEEGDISIGEHLKEVDIIEAATMNVVRLVCYDQ